jgi:hypothetical protein
MSFSQIFTSAANCLEKARFGVKIPEMYLNQNPMEAEGFMERYRYDFEIGDGMVFTYLTPRHYVQHITAGARITIVKNEDVVHLYRAFNDYISEAVDYSRTETLRSFLKDLLKVRKEILEDRLLPRVLSREPRLKKLIGSQPGGMLDIVSNFSGQPLKHRSDYIRIPVPKELEAWVYEHTVPGGEVPSLARSAAPFAGGDAGLFTVPSFMSRLNSAPPKKT